MTLTTRVWFGLALGLSALGLATACGGDGKEGGGPSSGGTGGNAASGGSGGTGALPYGGGSGGVGASDGGGGDGNDTLETATEVSLGSDPSIDGIQATLDEPGNDVDWYEFQGEAGQAIAIAALAQLGSNPYDATYPDLVVTLFDGNGEQIAEQDDQIPANGYDPVLFTQLPAAGTYYVRVLDCNSWDKGGASYCNDISAVVHDDYLFYVGKLGGAKPGEVKEVEPNDDAGSATPFTFEASPQAGQYYLGTAYGEFGDASDTDAFAINVPQDLFVGANYRAGIYLHPQPGGKNGNGSTTSAGVVYLTTKSDPTNVIAKIDVSLGNSLSVPITIGTEYLLFQKRAATPSGSHDFYFTLPAVHDGNPVESDDVANDELATPEMLTENTPGHYFIEGDLTSPTDVDHFLVDTHPGASAINVFCVAERGGSGLRGFTLAVLNPDGTPGAGAPVTETASTDAELPATAYPATATQLVVELTAATPDPTVNSRFYRCGIHFVN